MFKRLLIVNTMVEFFDGTFILGFTAYRLVQFSQRKRMSSSSKAATTPSRSQMENSQAAGGTASAGIRAPTEQKEGGKQQQEGETGPLPDFNFFNQFDTNNDLSPSY